MRGWCWIALALSAGLPLGLPAASIEPPIPRLELSLRLDKARFEAGEPIPITAVILNRGRTPYSVQTSTEETGAWDGFAFIVTDASGRPVSRPQSPPWQENWIGSWLTINRHETYEHKLFLNYWFMPLEPGRYTVQATYTPPYPVGADHQGVLTIRSVPVDFEVALTTEMKMDVRIARLTTDTEKADPVAVDFLGFTGQSEVIPPLFEAVYDEDLHIQHRAANALNDLPADEVLAAALQKLQERGPNRTLAEWLASVGAPVNKIVPIYWQALDSPDSSTRIGAVTGLGLCAGNPAVTAAGQRIIRNAIKKALGDKEPDVRLEAVKALEETGPDDDAIAALAGAARQDPSSRVRERAAACLADIRSETVIPYLRDLLLTDGCLQPDFAAQLREIATPAARAVLRDGLKSANPRVQTACAKQLWLLQDPAAKPTLLNVLRSDDPDAKADMVDFLEDFARTQAGTAKPAVTFQPASLADWLEKQ